MKHQIFISYLIFSIIFIISCSENVVQIEDFKENGNILLKIDKETAPSNVVYVKAYLTRENYQTISSYLNVQSDTTADLLLSDIYVGTWHLKVDAEDINGIVCYTGETDVEIIEGETTQIFLTLQSTGVGTGSVYIYVNWEDDNDSEWIDYQNNPLIIPYYNYYDSYGISQPKVLYDNGTYKMWYVGVAPSAHKNIMYAESEDGLVWNKPLTFPVLSPDNGSNWDNWAVFPGAIIKENGVYKMYFNGFNDQYSQWNIGLATSTDGINWTKYSDPILYGTSDWEYQLSATSIIKRDGVYYLYFDGRNLPVRKIGVAISTDGINFSKYEENPVLTNDQGWELVGVSSPTVIDEGDTLKMAYMNSDGSGLGMAFSTDGLHWTKDNNNPFFTGQNTYHSWAAGKVGYPHWIKLENEERIYYAGTTIYNDVLRIGVMRKTLN